VRTSDSKSPGIRKGTHRPGLIAGTHDLKVLVRKGEGCVYVVFEWTLLNRAGTDVYTNYASGHRITTQAKDLPEYLAALMAALAGCEREVARRGLEYPAEA
jgi:hypothetical protein